MIDSEVRNLALRGALLIIALVGACLAAVTAVVTSQLWPLGAGAFIAGGGLWLEGFVPRAPRS